MKDRRLYHAVADKIVKFIDDGVFPVGTRLHGERELAEKFGVSRVTVREAEIALQAVGRVEIKTGSGVYVLDARSRSDDQLPLVSAFELTEARALIESEAAAVAAATMSENTHLKLDQQVQIMASAGPGSVEGERADQEFHRLIASASGNGVIIYVIETMWKMRTELESVKEVYESVCSADCGARDREHSQILDALRARDPAAARIAMRNHFARLLESMLDATEAQALQELRRKTTESRQRYLKSARL